MRLQERLRTRIVRRDELGEVQTVAGADVAFLRERNLACAAVVVLAYPSLDEIERRWAAAEIRFPYVPGLLSFREIPVLVRAFEKLAARPDVVLFDGQGIAHPRRIGLAAHAGLILDVPSVGCAKSRLVGEAAEPRPEVGEWSPLRDGEEVIGAVVRTRRGVKPVYVSIGHRVSLPTAIRLVLGCLDRTRIPKPTREADRYADEVKRRLAAGRAQSGK